MSIHKQTPTGTCIVLSGILALDSILIASLWYRMNALLQILGSTDRGFVSCGGANE
jgi:hypothetical protein